jgi:hypothetical protein
MHCEKRARLRFAAANFKFAVLVELLGRASFLLRITAPQQKRPISAESRHLLLRPSD